LAADLAFVLLLVCIAPILFQKLPRKMLIFSAIYPFLAFWLIWGGTVLTPVVVALSLIAGYLAFVKIERLTGFATGLLSGVVAVALVLYLGSFVTAACLSLSRLSPWRRGIWGALCSTLFWEPSACLCPFR
jgi:general L-amino acid transport system permease protein